MGSPPFGATSTERRRHLAASSGPRTLPACVKLQAPDPQTHVGLRGPATGPTLGELGELALIATMTADLPPAADVLVGPGDDGAVLAVAGPLVTSLDVLVEGVHFSLDWSERRDIGRKAVAVNVADIEAMGGGPRGWSSGFSAPRDLPVRWALDLAAGLRAECAAAGVSLLGGDITRPATSPSPSPCSGRSTAGAPYAAPAPARRRRRRLGRTGWAAAGLAVLSRGFRSPRAVVEAQRVPRSPTARAPSPPEPGRPPWSTSPTACWPTSATSPAPPASPST